MSTAYGALKIALYGKENSRDEWFLLTSDSGSPFHTLLVEKLEILRPLSSSSPSSSPSLSTPSPSSSSSSSSTPSPSSSSSTFEKQKFHPILSSITFYFESRFSHHQTAIPTRDHILMNVYIPPLTSNSHSALIVQEDCHAQSGDPTDDKLSHLLLIGEATSKCGPYDLDVAFRECRYNGSVTSPRFSYIAVYAIADQERFEMGLYSPLYNQQPKSSIGDRIGVFHNFTCLFSDPDFIVKILRYCDVLVSFMLDVYQSDGVYQVLYNHDSVLTYIDTFNNQAPCDLVQKMKVRIQDVAAGEKGQSKVIIDIIDDVISNYGDYTSTVLAKIKGSHLFKRNANQTPFSRQHMDFFQQRSEDDIKATPEVEVLYVLGPWLAPEAQAQAQTAQNDSQDSQETSPSSQSSQSLPLPLSESSVGGIICTIISLQGGTFPSPTFDTLSPDSIRDCLPELFQQLTRNLIKLHAQGFTLSDIRPQNIVVETLPIVDLVDDPNLADDLVPNKVHRCQYRLHLIDTGYVTCFVPQSQSPFVPELPSTPSETPPAPEGIDSRLDAKLRIVTDITTLKTFEQFNKFADGISAQIGDLVQNQDDSDNELDELYSSIEGLQEQISKCAKAISAMKLTTKTQPISSPPSQSSKFKSNSIAAPQSSKLDLSSHKVQGATSAPNTHFPLIHPNVNARWLIFMDWFCLVQIFEKEIVEKKLSYKETFEFILRLQKITSEKDIEDCQASFSDLLSRFSKAKQKLIKAKQKSIKPSQTQ